MSRGSSSGSSSRLDAEEPSLDRRPSSKRFTSDQTFELEPLPTSVVTPVPTHRERSWAHRTQSTLGLRHPWILRGWTYFRGPRPKEDLPVPTPLLDRTYTIRGRTYSIHLESLLRRFTRPLTAPWLFVILAAAWIVGFAFFSRAQSFLIPPDSFITCTSTYWAANIGCGLNGNDCLPSEYSTFDFRCPAQCSSVILQNPRTIGAEEMAFVPLIVGGGDANRTYRADSFLCAAGVQAGLISNSAGGCASLQLVANFTDFIPFTGNGLSSVGFPTVFPLSFQLRPNTALSQCKDFRIEALAFNVIITALLFWVLRPKPIVLYWCLVCIGFWHITLFSQPQSSPPLLDEGFRQFLPALFVAYGFWRLAFRFVLPAFRKAPIEASVWYLVPFWVGVNLNNTFDRLPISRLVAADIKARPGALVTVIVLVLVIFALVVNQMRVIRKTGWLPHYLGWYIAGGLTALVLSQLPGLQLRLHHYILAMVLMPGTGFPTRVSAICQGLLLGMFLNGVAAFGFDSILQTAADLRRDAVLGSDLPSFVTNAGNWNTSIPFLKQIVSWDAPPEGWDGFSLLVDDVERYVGNALNFSLAALDPALPHFFRLALVSRGQTGDFTNAATLWPNGTWVDPQPGPSF